MTSRGEVVEKVREDIERDGWSDIGVFPVPEEPGLPFNYTVGLTARKHPELLVMGIGTRQMHSVLQAAYERIEEGTTFRANHYAEQVLIGMPVAFVEITDILNDEFPLTMAVEVYGGVVDALQLVWPDYQGRFPWQPNFDEELRTRQVPLGKWEGTV